jgi:hypothetical protein
MPWACAHDAGNSPCIAALRDLCRLVPDRIGFAARVAPHRETDRRSGSLAAFSLLAPGPCPGPAERRWRPLRSLPTMGSPESLVRAPAGLRPSRAPHADNASAPSRARPARFRLDPMRPVARLADFAFGAFLVGPFVLAVDLTAQHAPIDLLEHEDWHVRNDAARDLVENPPRGEAMRTALDELLAVLKRAARPAVPPWSSDRSGGWSSAVGLGGRPTLEQQLEAALHPSGASSWLSQPMIVWWSLPRGRTITDVEDLVVPLSSAHLAAFVAGRWFEQIDEQARDLVLERFGRWIEYDQWTGDVTAQTARETWLSGEEGRARIREVLTRDRPVYGLREVVFGVGSTERAARDLLWEVATSEWKAPDVVVAVRQVLSLTETFGTSGEFEERVRATLDLVDRVELPVELARYGEFLPDGLEWLCGRLIATHIPIRRRNALEALHQAFWLSGWSTTERPGDRDLAGPLREALARHHARWPNATTARLIWTSAKDAESRTAAIDALLQPFDFDRLTAEIPAPDERSNGIRRHINGSQSDNGYSGESYSHEARRLVFETVRGLGRLVACEPEDAPFDERIETLLIHMLQSREDLDRYAAASVAAELGPRARSLEDYLKERALPMFRTEERAIRFELARECLEWTAASRSARLAELETCRLADLRDVALAIESRDDPSQCRRFGFADDVTAILVTRGLRAVRSGDDGEARAILDLFDSCEAPTTPIWPLVVALRREADWVASPPTVDGAIIEPWIPRAPDATTIASWIAADDTLGTSEPDAEETRVLIEALDRFQTLGEERATGDSRPTLPDATRGALLRIGAQAVSFRVRVRALEALAAWADAADRDLVEATDAALAEAVVDFGWHANTLSRVRWHLVDLTRD